MNKRFIHCGEIGDLLYSLPTIKAMGGGDLYLVNDHIGQRTRFTAEEHDSLLAELLLAQPYVNGLFWKAPILSNGLRLSGRDICTREGIINLNFFRWANQPLLTQHLSDSHSKAQGLPGDLAEEPWLSVDRLKLSPAPVIFSRSQRHRNLSFPWKRAYEQYGEYAAFVGTAAEHDAFVREVGDVPHYVTDTLHDAAQAIDASILFVGNQSAPLAIAEGLGKAIVCEVCIACPNCNLKRANYTAGVDENVKLPDLEETYAVR